MLYLDSNADSTDSYKLQYICSKVVLVSVCFLQFFRPRYQKHKFHMVKIVRA